LPQWIQAPSSAARCQLAGHSSGSFFGKVEVVIGWPFIRKGNGEDASNDIGLTRLNQE